MVPLFPSPGTCFPSVYSHLQETKLAGYPVRVRYVCERAMSGCKATNDRPCSFSKNLWSAQEPQQGKDPNMAGVQSEISMARVIVSGAQTKAK